MRKLVVMIAVFFAVSLASAQAAPGFTKVTNVTTTSYTDTSCGNQTTCYYQVTAVDAQGHESVPAACASTVLCFGGNQVVVVMPSSGTHSVALTWTASTTTGVTYNVYRAVGPLSATGLSLVIN